MRQSHWTLAAMGVLTVGLMSSGCGQPVEEPAVGAEEEVGTAEEALCSGLSVTQLTLTEASSYGGELSAVGTWAVSLLANATRLEYRVNGTLRAVDERPGNSGTWYHSTHGLGCGTHTLEVKAYPMVIDSNRNRTTCYSGSRTLTQSVVQACPSASVSCQRTSSSFITCTGSGSGGAGGYTPYWKQGGTPDGGGWVEGSWYQGSWSQQFYCVETYVLSPADMLQIDFKVRDVSGMESQAWSQTFLCEPGAIW